MKTRRSVLIGIIVVTLSTATLGSGQVKWKGSVVKEGDVTVVRNPKEPLYKTSVLELKEDLSLGGPEAQGDYAFGEARNFVVDDDGSIYVLDAQSAHVKVFDRSGKYARTIGRVPLKPAGVEILKGKYYALEEDEDGYQLVKRYAVTWAVK